MSIRWMNRVWDHSAQGGSGLLLMIALADQANDQGICWPSVGSLARKTRLSERTVQEVLHGAPERPGHPARPGLVDSGELEVLEGGGRGRASTYRLTVRDSHPSESPNGTSHSANGANLAPNTETVSAAAGKGAATRENGASDTERVRDFAETVRHAAPQPVLTVIGTVIGTVKEPSSTRARENTRPMTGLHCERCSRGLEQGEPSVMIQRGKRYVCMDCRGRPQARASP